MDFLRLLQSETTTANLRRILVMAAVSGLSNAMVLAIINSAADSATRAGDALRLMLMFVAVVAIFTISQRFIMMAASKEIERIIHRIRKRLVAAVQHCELPDIERIGRTTILNGASKEIQSLAQSSNTLVLTSQMAVVVVFATGYLMTLSLVSFALAATFTAVAATVYVRRMRHVNAAIGVATQKEYKLHDLLTGMLEGFKEIKLNERRGAAIAHDIAEASLDAATERVRAQVELARNFVFVQDVFFLLLATMVFIVPVISATYGDVVVKTTTAVLFLIGPISGVVSSAASLVTANNSAIRIVQLERLLQDRGRRPAGAGAPAAGRPVAVEPLRSFHTIELSELFFRFPDPLSEHPFQVGPLSLTISAGETIFVSGGNGSGKSTFMRLLTTLYWPQQGTIRVDGRPVTQANVDAYRALFSAIFPEYHLFKRLYGIDEAALAEGPQLLRDLEIADKTSIEGDTFSTIDLSAGQRKRLALVVALLERRPICVLDEWAADQDPVFRRKFYEELLRQLKARGITIIAVTHDDRYYDLADRRLHMEEGRFAGAQGEAGHS
jgi:putative pyoverdin transport system ATP-binding/permease protein